MKQDAKTINMMEKSKTESQVQSENVNKVINKIGEEIVSLNSLIRAFIAVAEEDSFANYMLETICESKKDARIVLNVNQIKAAVIKAYPYKDGNTMLKKDGDLYVPMTKYGKDIIRKSFYNIVNPKKEKIEIIPATPEQIEAHNLKKEADKVIKAEEKKSKQESIDNFINRLMEAGNKDLAWAIVQEYKANHTKTEQDSKAK